MTNRDKPWKPGTIRRWKRPAIAGAELEAFDAKVWVFRAARLSIRFIAEDLGTTIYAVQQSLARTKRKRGIRG